MANCAVPGQRAWVVECDADGNPAALRAVPNPSYQIELCTLRTFADVDRWMAHLSPKGWVTGLVLFDFYVTATSLLPETERPQGFNAPPR